VERLGSRAKYSVQPKEKLKLKKNNSFYCNKKDNFNPKECVGI
jgi:hypothetical protein